VDTGLVDKKGEPKLERITLYRDDKPGVVAAEFCKRRGFDSQTMKVLEKQMADKLIKVMDKLEAKQEKKRQ